MGTTLNGNIPASVQPPQTPNLLQNALQATALQNQGNQAMMFQQQFAARQAMGPILQNAIDPETGQMDYGKAFVGLASHPQTAFMAGDFFKNMVETGKMQADTALTQATTAQKHFELIGNTLSPLVQQGPGVKLDDAVNALGNLAGSAPSLYPEIMGLINKWHTNGWTGGAPLANDIRTIAMGAVGGAKTLENTLQVINTGGQQIPVNYNRYGGTATGIPGANGQPLAFTNTMTPEGLNNLVMTKGANGEDIPVPRAQAAPVLNGAGVPMPGTGQGVPLGAPSGPVTALPPDVAEYQAGKGPSAEYEQGLNSAAQIAQQQLPVLNKQMQLLKQFYAGGGTEVRTSLANLARTAGMPDATVKLIQGGNTAAAQEFEKYALLNAFTAIRQASGHYATSPEFEKVASVLQSPSSNPEAIQGVTDTMLNLLKRTVAEQGAFAKARGAAESLTPADVAKMQSKYSGTAPYVAAGGKVYFRPQNWPATWTGLLARTGQLNSFGGAAPAAGQ